MTIKQQVEGLAKPMHVGDAITRTVEIDADHTESMVIPRPSFTAPDGVRIYKKDPQLTDLKDERGQFEGGRRVDVVTYRFEQPGSYTLPKVSVSWFDPSTQKTQQAEVPEIQVTLVAAAAPKDAIAPEAPSEQAALPPEETIDWQRWIVPAAALLGVLAIAWLVRRWPARIRGFVTAEGQTRHESESAYFSRVLAACRANDPSQRYAALAAWVQRTGAASIAGYVQASPDGALQKQVTELEQQLYASGKNTGQWTGAALASALEAVRRSSRQSHHPPRRWLSSLNPIGDTASW